MRVYTKNTERTNAEMNQMFRWCRTRIGDPGNSDSKWTYGREPGFLGSDLCSGPEDIEYIDFTDDIDATAFILKWS